MGVVYLAEDTRLHLNVALKFLPTSLTADEEARERFEHEAQAAALNHPNIITVHEIDECGGQVYIVMEHVEGETLRERIARSNRGEPLEPKEILDIVAQICVMLFHLALFATLPSDTDIIDAVNDGNLDRAKAMLEKIPKLAEERSERDATPLHIAAHKGYAAIAAALLEAGADPDPRDVEGETPLHWAALEGRSDIAELLLDRGASVNARNARQFTPLHYALMMGHVGVVRTLIGRGAEIDTRNVQGETPYDRAVSSGEQAIARYLASQRALTSRLDLPTQN